MLNPNLVEELAAALGTKPGLVEKDWHVVRALGVLSSLDFSGATQVFSGGTSLSKGWGIIKRFSEDIDFKVIPPAAASPTANRNQRRAFRKRVLAALTANEFELAGDPLISTKVSFSRPIWPIQAILQQVKASGRTFASRCPSMRRRCSRSADLFNRSWPGRKTSLPRFRVSPASIP